MFQFLSQIVNSNEGSLPMEKIIQIMEKSTHFIFVASFTLFSCVPGVLSEDHCLDHKGQWVPHGERYFPLGTDPCTQCTCINGTPEVCISVFCSPPENCRQYHALNDKCCQFVCLDVPLGGNVTEINKDDSLTATNLGLRLVASAVTSFLILALLLFMIHRLRQRRLLLVIRRLNGQGLDSNQPGGQQYAIDDEGSVGYFAGHDQLDFGGYDEPPPPYCFWKPPEAYIPTGEAPPPYEATEAPNHNNNNASAGLTQVTTGFASPKAECDMSVQTGFSREVREVGTHVTVVHLDSNNRLSTERLHQEDITNGNLLPGTSTDVPVHREMNIHSKQLARNEKHRSYNEERLLPVERSRRFSSQVSGTGFVVCPDPTEWIGEGSSNSTSPTSTTCSDPQSTISPSSSDTTSPEVDFVRQGASGQSEVLGVIPENIVAKSKFEKTLLKLKQLSQHRGKPKLRKNAKGSNTNNTSEPHMSRPTNLNLNSWVVAGIRVHTNPTCNESIDEGVDESTSSFEQVSNLNFQPVSTNVMDNGERRLSYGSTECSESSARSSLSRSGSVCSETGERKLKQGMKCQLHKREGVFCNCTYVTQACSNNHRSSRFSLEGSLSES